MKNINNKIKSVKVDIDSVWLSYQMMMANASNSKNNKHNLTIDNIINTINNSYEEVVDEDLSDNKTHLSRIVHNYASQDLARDFMHNLNYKNKEFIAFKIPEEWFLNHLLLASVYNPKKSIIWSAKNIVTQLQKEYYETRMYSPELDNDEIIYDTFCNASYNIFSSFEDGPIYRKFLKSFEEDIN